MHRPAYKVVSLFSGAMGLDVGLESTERFRVSACVESVPAFCDTIRRNIRSGHLDPTLRVFQGDIRQFDPYEVLDALGLEPGQLDLLVGGPPCQSFSTAGRRRTVQDPRGTLLWQFLRFVDAMKPKFFVMENVRGLLSAALSHRPISQRPEKGGPPLRPDDAPAACISNYLPSAKASLFFRFGTILPSRCFSLGYPSDSTPTSMHCSTTDCPAINVWMKSGGSTILGTR